MALDAIDQTGFYPENGRARLREHVGEDVLLWFAVRDSGIGLTEEYMMDPEASVSAVVFHHPDARYLA